MAFLFRYPIPVLGVLCAMALVSAYVAQYGFGLLPCEMCLWQRIPFYIVIALALLAVPLQQPAQRRILLGLIALALLANVGIAAWHTGVEQSWWPGPSACSADITSFKTVEELRAHIMQAAVVRCDRPALEVFGFLTMASANVVFCLALAAFAVRAILRSHDRTSA